MSKRKNRLLREQWALYQLSRNPDFIAGRALAEESQRGCSSASVDRSPEGEDPEGLHAEHESAVTAKPADARKDPS